jgi:hypothetical protein
MEDEKKRKMDDMCENSQIFKVRVMSNVHPFK